MTAGRPRNRPELHQVPAAAGRIADFARHEFSRDWGFAWFMGGNRGEPEVFAQFFSVKGIRVDVEQAREIVVGIKDFSTLLVGYINGRLQLFQHLYDCLLYTS